MSVTSVKQSLGKLFTEGVWIPVGGGDDDNTTVAVYQGMMMYRFKGVFSGNNTHQTEAGTDQRQSLRARALAPGRRGVGHAGPDAPV